MKSSEASRRKGWPWALAAAGVAFWAVRRRMRRIDFRGMSVVISGGSRGLGLELARQLAREGARLSLLARSAEELERAGRELNELGAEVLTFPCDIADRQQVEEAVAAIVEFRGGVDVLINNAGIIQVAPFENLELEDFRDSLAVHAWGPLHLIRAVAPHMQRRKTGRIVNISSIGGLVAVPHLLAYTVGKFALTGLSSGLRAELAKDGVLVTTVAPGLMRTGSHVRAFFKGQNKKEYAWFAISGANPLLSTTARRAARKIVNACRYGDPFLCITVPARLLRLFNALFPSASASVLGAAARFLPAPAATEENALVSGWESRSAAAPALLTALSDRAIRRYNE